MDSHDKIRELLALAAAGALDANEDAIVTRHIATCPSCSAELDEWRLLARGLRRLPTPQPRAAVVERARARAEICFAEETEQRWHRRIMVFLVLFAWVLTLATWPLVRMFSGGLLVWFDPRFNQTWLAFAGFTGFVWGTGGLAAIMLGRNRQRERRLA
ncbi:MAG: zf-HC2 domain-containing protein [Candidatus Acidiferrales bacterium]